MTVKEYRLLWLVVALTTASSLFTLLFFVPDAAALPASAKVAIILWTLFCFAVGSASVPRLKP